MTALDALEPCFSDQYAKDNPNPYEYEFDKQQLDGLLAEFHGRSQHMVLSVKFDKKRNANRFATAVYEDWKGDVGRTQTGLGQIIFDKARIYNPNEVNKTGVCNVEDCWKHPETCEARNFCQGKPTIRSCWKQSFFWHLQQIQSNKVPGVMVRIVEGNELGPGQKIEKAMAEHLGTYVLEVHAKETDDCARNSRDLTFESGDQVRAIQSGNTFKEGDLGSVTHVGTDSRGDHAIIMWHGTGRGTRHAKSKLEETFRLESKAVHLEEADTIRVLPGRQFHLGPHDYFRAGDVGRVVSIYHKEPGDSGCSELFAVKWFRSGNVQFHMDLASWRQDFVLEAKAKKMLITGGMPGDPERHDGHIDGVYREFTDETGDWHSVWYKNTGRQPMVIHALTADMETGESSINDAKWVLHPYNGCVLDGFSDLKDTRKLAREVGRPVYEAADSAFFVDKPYNTKWGRWVGTGRTKRFEEKESLYVRDQSTIVGITTRDEKELMIDVENKLKKKFGITKQHLSMTATEADLDFVKEWQAKMPKPAWNYMPGDKEAEKEALFYSQAHDVLKEELKRRFR